MDKKVSGGAYGKPYLATTKPVLQISTKTAGISRNNTLALAAEGAISATVYLARLRISGIAFFK